MKSHNTKIWMAILASASITLSIAHHQVNFWGLEITTEAVILLLALPLLTFPILFFLNRTWSTLILIPKIRWIIFLIPTLLIAATLTYYFHKAPVIWHTITLIPQKGIHGAVYLHEIKYPPGKTIKFDKIAPPKGWIHEKNALYTAADSETAPLQFSFLAPIGSPTSLLLTGSPNGGKLVIVLDGQRTELTLQQETESHRLVQLPTPYKMGIDSSIILTITAAADFLALLFTMLIIWLAQEIPQTHPRPTPNKEDVFFSHPVALTFLIGAGLLLHTFNALSVQLILASDSPSFLAGAVYWVKHGNFDGVPAARGPLMTIFFIPAFWFFNGSPWAAKITMHVLALASIPAAYALGWQLYKRRAFAFIAGLTALLMPEMYLYSNIIMSDVPNIALTLVFCATALSAFNQFSAWRVITTLLLGSVAALHRSENILLILITGAFLVLKTLWEKEAIRQRLGVILIAGLLAALPLLGWSAHNYRLRGFFGLSNYAGAIWYDGWIYFGEASKFPITDMDAPSVRAIHQAVKAYGKPIEYVVAPTSLELYPALRAYGYSDQETMQLFSRAAMESIKNDPALALQLYLLKLRKSFVPEYNTLIATTFPPSGEARTAVNKGFDFFENEHVIYPPLLNLQKQAYNLLLRLNPIYGALSIFGLAFALLSVYRKNFFTWATLTVITLSRLFVGVTMGLGSWRYMLSGVALLLIFALLAIQIAQQLIVVIKNPEGV